MTDPQSTMEAYSYRVSARLRTDPIPSLLASGNQALLYFVGRDLLDRRVGPVRDLWELPEARKILGKQQFSDQQCGFGRYGINNDIADTF